MPSESAAIEQARQHPLAVALRGALSSHRDAVLQAPPGAGKSTLVPLSLLQGELIGSRNIIMLEPRRLAARAIAARMAYLLGQNVGDTVGYRMRLDTRVSRATRIEVVTEGVLTRMLQEDPALERVACLIFDEYHERSLAADLGLAFALDARRELGASFRILVMSATLAGERVAALLGDAAVVDVPGRAFPIELHYLGRGPPLLPSARSTGGPTGEESIERLAAAAVRRALAESAGDVLVFLPGVREIRRLESMLKAAELPSGVRPMCLYGDLPGAAQDAVLAPALAGERKIVLATNIAETSVTIPGVTAVVDAGLVRRAHFDPTTGMSRLEVARISRAASEQRAGRAGRVAAGVCYRLWSEGAQASLMSATPPEIVEADLAPVALELARWGADDVARLSWLDQPPAASLQQARDLLLRLDALNAHGRLTSLGRDMARLPVHPRLAHMLLAARGLDAITLAAQLAALLSDRDVLRRGAASGAHDPDIRTRLELLRADNVAVPMADGIERNALERVRRAAKSLQAAVLALPGAAHPPRRSAARPDMTGGLLALAYPDRIGQRRSGSGGRYLLANGRGAAFFGQPGLAREEFIVALELDDREREARIDLAAPLSRALLEELFADRIVTEERFGWQSRAEAVVAQRVRRLDALLLEELQLPAAEDDRALPAMIEGLRQLGLEALPWDQDSRTLQARMEFVRTLQRADLADWPASDDHALLSTLEHWLAPYLTGITRREQLARVPLTEALRAQLGPVRQRVLDTLAPRELCVPSGSQVRIDYSDPRAPSIAVRLQEVFGLAATPRIAAGSIAITFRLLSPAQRPVQVTSDLAGFWRSSYAQVRKDLRGRYPKHEWPEDPLLAVATRSAKRRTGGAPRGRKS
ncbi:MAG TPA: ATP-dependent helicase HrpB [Steroidobacteraceae bacterium]